MSSLDRVGATTASEIEQRHSARMRMATARVEEVIVSSLDWDEMLDVLSMEVVRAGIFRSLTVGVVNWDEHYIEFARNFLSVDKGGEINPSSEEIAAGKVGVIESGSLIGTRISAIGRSYTSGADLHGGHCFITYKDKKIHSAKMAYFIPIMFGEKVTAVIATGSDIEEQTEMV